MAGRKIGEINFAVLISSSFNALPSYIHSLLFGRSIRKRCEIYTFKDLIQLKSGQFNSVCISRSGTLKWNA